MFSNDDIRSPLLISIQLDVITSAMRFGNFIQSLFSRV